MRCIVSKTQAKILYSFTRISLGRLLMISYTHINMNCILNASIFQTRVCLILFSTGLCVAIQHFPIFVCIFLFCFHSLCFYNVFFLLSHIILLLACFSFIRISVCANRYNLEIYIHCIETNKGSK